MKENYFSSKMERKSTTELEAMLERKQDYQEDAILAATWELEKRGSEEFKYVEKDITEHRKKQEEVKKKESPYTDAPNAPLLYPK